MNSFLKSAPFSMNFSKLIIFLPVFSKIIDWRCFECENTFTPLFLGHPNPQVLQFV